MLGLGLVDSQLVCGKCVHGKLVSLRQSVAWTLLRLSLLEFLTTNILRLRAIKILKIFDYI